VGWGAAHHFLLAALHWCSVGGADRTRLRGQGVGKAMGSFYANHTVHSTDRRKVVSALAGRSAFVTPAKDGAIVVFDKASDSLDRDVVRSLGAHLSQQLGVAVLSVTNCHDDLLYYALFEGGQCTDEYDSCPECPGEASEIPKPSGGNATRLCAAFGGGDVARVEEILREPTFESDKYLFQHERHRDLVQALGLPDFAIAYGYYYIANDDLPPGLSLSDLKRTK
jgi:hypothetical protein